MTGENHKNVFSANLIYYMNLNEKKQIDLMKDLHLSSSTISNWCTGLKFPRMDKIQMLADYFHIKCSDFIEEKNRGIAMTDEAQKKIFSKNLNNYLLLSNKTQREVAEAIGVSPQTFNTWCQGIALPRMGKVQLLADYFHINKSDLIDEKTKEQKQAERDERDIAKDLQNIMDKLKRGESGPASFDGEEIPEETQELFAQQLDIMLHHLKKINKEKYNPYKNKK